MLQPITRPKGAEAAMVQAPAVHTTHSPLRAGARFLVQP